MFHLVTGITLAFTLVVKAKKVNIETIRNLNIDYTSKKKVLEGLLKVVNELESESDILEQTLNNKN